MMLPFFKPKAASVGLIVSERKPDSYPEPIDENNDAGLDACSADLILAVHAKSIKAVTAALKAAFELLDSQPHVEGPHIDEQE
jgi:hypothetical protein